MTPKQFGEGNFMRLPDGPGFSPDGGHFWVKGDLLYWDDGSVWDMRDGGMIRTMSPLVGHENGVPESEWHKYEDYSAWSDEKRSAMLADKKRATDEQKSAEQAEEEAIRALCISAKAKLTKEEYDAVQWGRYDSPKFAWKDLP